ncbi:hypothetical protein CXB51_025504 [Gossypium anomalum]|uniref:Cytochrome P450 n=1 Tax=Gossypium anomalum TaxID=47600 RepID=A0A8J6CRL9_9ROSI|nr:hypothetical protein CXB51_025504 [Gossypium anomalum]
MDYSSFTNTSYQIYQLPSWNRSHDMAVISTLLVSLPLPLVLLLLVFGTPCGFKLKGIITTRSQPPLPPGPIPWPIIGNLPEIWQNKPVFRWILGLIKQLGTDIACIRLGHVHIIALENFLKKHDSVFSSRPKTMAAEYATRGFLSTALVPWGDQWKKMKKTQEADNLVRFIYNQCINHENMHGGVINLRLAVRQYTGNVIRRMMFNRRYFGKGREDGGPGYEEQQHVESLFTVLMHLNSFILSDYVPWLRPLDLEGHEKIVSEAMRIVNGYHDPLNKRVGTGKRKEPQDLLDAFILAKDLNGKPVLSAEEIKAQITELMLATVDNPANAAEWAMAEMLNNPEILRKATDEIDSVVGKSRLVEETDIPNSTTLNAVQGKPFDFTPLHLSTFPMSPTPTPLSPATSSLKAVIRRGLDPKVWEEPLEFKPERHLKDEWGSGGVELTENELRFISFGTGRRGCIEVGLGSAVTIMLFARLIQGFTWEVPPNVTKIDLSESEDDTLLAKPLHALAKPRLSPALYTQL